MNNDYLANEYLPRALDTWAPERIRPLVIGGRDFGKEEGISPAEMYLSLGFAGEWGEVCELLKRMMRDDDGACLMQDELGDALWYAAVLHHTTEDDYVRTLCESRVGEIMGIARACGWTLEEVGERNLTKLADRKARGVISGKGGDR
jgi:hypothetical protein